MNRASTSDSALETLYALKAGVVPPVGADEITVGRTNAVRHIERTIKAVLANSEPRVDFIEGTYGDGKSHLMGLARARILESGCAVISLTADFTTVTLHRPAPLMIAATSHLELPGRPGIGMIPLLRNLVDQPEFRKRARLLYDSWYRYPSRQGPSDLGPWPSGFFVALERPDLFEPIGRWLSGEKMRITDLRRQVGQVAVAPQVMALTKVSLPGVLQGLASSLELLGYGGLAILIDEAENALGPMSSPAARRDSCELLFQLSQGRSPIYVLAAATPATAAPVERDFELRSHLRRRFFPYESKFVLDRLRSPDLIKVTALSRRNLNELGRNIVDIHSRAFGWDATPHLPSQVLENLVGRSVAFNEPTRGFVRRVVSALELCEQHRGLSAERLLAMVA